MIIIFFSNFLCACALIKMLRIFLNFVIIFQFFIFYKMSKTWSSVHETTFKQTSKLEPNKIYQISDIKSIKTKFGYKNILIDDGLNEYWTNRKVDEFLAQNRNVSRFTIITSSEKQFEDKDKKIIKYFDVEIQYD